MTFWVLGLAYLMLDSHVFAQEVATDSIGTRYRLIEGGRFVQGTTGGERALERAFPLSTAGQFFGNAEAPAHVTWITKPYYIAETEVTVAQFRKFVEETGYVTSAEKPDTQMAGWLPTPKTSLSTNRTTSFEITSFHGARQDSTAGRSPRGRRELLRCQSLLRMAQRD